MTNGIPITLRTADADGKMTQIETPVFATAKRCPALLGKLKAIARADIAETAAAKRMRAADRHLRECPEEETDKAQEAANQASDAVTDAGAAVLDALREFIVAGFIGAGYTQDQAERYASFVDAERIAELKAVCLLGTGHLDFTKATN